MRKYISLLFILSLVASTSAQVTWSEPTVEPKGKNFVVSTTATIDKGWHIYDMAEYDFGLTSTSLNLLLPSGVELVGAVKPSQQPTREYDDLFEAQIGYFEGELTLSQEIKNTTSAAQNIEVTVEWMACGEGQCTPPNDVAFDITVPHAPTSGVWRLLLEALLWGFVALLTPCVFPMVPMTISYFIKGGHGRSTALMYGLFIVALYTIPIGVIILATYVAGGDAVMGDIFNFLATHWIPNLLFFVVFMVFAASFLGAFELTLPSSWVNGSDKYADRGSVVGVFFLALTLVLVSFSCTGPIVGSVLISSTRGEFWMPIATIFVFSAAFALPFVVFAMFPELLKKMPSSGGWLSSVKVVLGFLEIALGLKFLSVADQTYHWGILPRELYLAIWIVVFTLLGLYLLGILRIGHDEGRAKIGVGRLFLAAATLSFVVYILPGMWGEPLPALAGYLPPPKGVEVAQGVEPKADNLTLERAQQLSLEQNKPILVYLTGYGCVNCREMEQRVLSNAEVSRILRDDYIVVKLYMDDKREVPQSEWVELPNGRVLKSAGRINSHLAIERWGVNAQPYYIILDSEGNEKIPPRGYDLSVEGYIEFLERGVSGF